MTRRETTTKLAPKTAAASGKQYSELPGLDWRTVTLRLAGTGLLIAAGAIHLDLYLTGYRTIPTIGWLFLLQVIVGFALGLAVLTVGGLPVLAAQLAAAGERSSRWPPSAATCCRSASGCSGSARSAPPQAFSPA